MNDPANWLYQELAPVMDRLDLLTSAASRSATINKVFGSHMAPHEIAEHYADEDIDLLIAWMEHTPDAER